MLNQDLWFTAPAGDAEFYSRKIDQSVRFDGTAHLKRTTTAGNRKKWTYSAWIKRTKLATDSNPIHYTFPLVSSYTDSNNRLYVRWRYETGTPPDNLQMYGKVGGTVINLSTTAQFRDTSSWYHIVIAVDTTQSTAADRVKLYVNGATVPFTGTYPAQNAETNMNRASTSLEFMKLGSDYNPSYLADLHWIDGTAYAATDFGEFKEGVWIPKAFTGTYGTNGAHLDFADSSNLGNDVSGQNHDFTATGFATHDAVPDSPTNNFATLNPNYTYATGSPTNGALEYNSPTAAYAMTTGTMAVPTTGKWYWETRIIAAASVAAIGVSEVQFPIGNFRSENNNLITQDTETSCIGKSRIYYQTTREDNHTALANNDIVQIAYDSDNNKIWFGINNTWQVGNSQSGTANPGTNTLGFAHTHGEVMPAFSDGSGSAQAHVYVNFGQDATFGGRVSPSTTYSDTNDIGQFYYDPPEGFAALCTQNLTYAEGGPSDLPSSVNPSDHFKAFKYTGNGTNGQQITGVGFKPGLLLQKRIDAAGNPIFTSMLAPTSSMRWNSLGGYNTGTLSSFDADGFTASTGGGTSFQANVNNGDYVAYAWKLSSATVSNTDGDITSTVAANTDAGVSVISYTGTGTANDTVGHGLTKAPEFIIVKKTNSNKTWVGWHKYLAWNYGFDFAGLNPPHGDYNPLGSNGASSTTISLDNGSHANQSGQPYVAYLFHSVPGFSKVGTYEGTNNVNGAYVHLGFKPAMVIIKPLTGTSNATRTFWTDSARNPTNPVDGKFFPDANSANTSGTTYHCDYTSNGFKLRNTNSSQYSHDNRSHVYGYIAFAEDPAKYANAR